jgi:hypothetical protein
LPGIAGEWSWWSSAVWPGDAIAEFREVLIPSLIRPAEIHTLNLSLLATSQRGSFSWFGKAVGMASGLLDGARRLRGADGDCPAAEELERLFGARTGLGGVGEDR